MKRRILAIDDEEKWRDDYRRWISSDLADVESAGSAADGAELLRRRRYNCVLLDLSMNPGNALDRSTRPIQEYLAAKPEGTLYIVASGVLADKAEEVRDAAFRKGAAQVLFKPEIDYTVLSTELSRLFDLQGDLAQRFRSEAKNRLIGDGFLESQTIAALGAGATSFFQALDTLFQKIAPVAQHRDRPKFVALGNVVVALTWSRELGHAVSVVLSRGDHADSAAASVLAGWLGFPTGPVLFSNTMGGHIRVQCFSETSISPDHFDLPSII